MLGNQEVGCNSKRKSGNYVVVIFVGITVLPGIFNISYTNSKRGSCIHYDRNKRNSTHLHICKRNLIIIVLHAD